jgi:hypothetical protein
MDMNLRVWLKWLKLLKWSLVGLWGKTGMQTAIPKVSEMVKIGWS